MSFQGWVLATNAMFFAVILEHAVTFARGKWRESPERAHRVGLVLIVAMVGGLLVATVAALAAEAVG